MDIRTRLLITFLPLFLALISFALVMPFGVTQGTEALEEQRLVVEDLVQGEELVLAILLEHDEVGHIVAGENPPDSPRYLAARARAAELAAAEAEEEDASVDFEAQIAEEYALLSQAHNEAIAFVVAGDLATAGERFEQPEVDQALDRIYDLGRQASAANRQEVEQITTTTIRGSERGLYIIGAIFLGAVAMVSGLTWLLVQQIVTPLNRLAADAERYASGETSGELSDPGSITQIRRLRDSFQNLLNANAARRQQIERSLHEIETRSANESRLRETVQALSLPVIPLADDTLLLPLIGYLDEQRAAELNHNLLTAINQRRAQRVVLDLTGLAAIDDTTARILTQAATAARLLGCDVTLVGVRADQAMLLVNGNTGTPTFDVARDIQSVINAQSKR